MLDGVAVNEAITGTGVDVPPLLQAASVKATTAVNKGLRPDCLHERCMGFSSPRSELDESFSDRTKSEEPDRGWVMGTHPERGRGFPPTQSADPPKYLRASSRNRR
jgi:hypothetical protein